MVSPGIRSKLVLGAFALAAWVVSGCLAGGGSLTNLPTNETAIVKLKIRLGHVDSRSGIDPSVVNKRSSIQIQNLIVTFTSNLDDTLRDTVTSTANTANGTTFPSDSILVDVSLRAFRWWNIDIETRDQYDSVVHKGNAGPFSSKGGQVMDLSIPLLEARYLMYEARYALPSEIFSSNLVDTARVKQKIYFYRLVLEIDGVVIGDSTSFSPAITSPGSRFIFADTSKVKNAVGKHFFRPHTGLGADTVTHIQSYEYVKAGDHEFKMSAFGYLEGDSIGRPARLLFQGKSNIDVVKGGIPDVQEVKMIWTGPGSEFAKADTTETGVNTSNWNGINMSVILGRVRSGGVKVDIISEFPN